MGADAFAYVPEDTYDWLLCDLSARPLDVAKLIAKWGRRVWARQVIASFKLPMKRKAETLARIIATVILTVVGWPSRVVRVARPCAVILMSAP